MIFYHQYREGFATNSSSMHSILLVGGDVNIPDSGGAYQGAYGRDEFWVKDADEKEFYAFICLFDSLSRAVQAHTSYGEDKDQAEIFNLLPAIDRDDPRFQDLFAFQRGHLEEAKKPWREQDLDPLDFQSVSQIMVEMLCEQYEIAQVKRLVEMCNPRDGDPYFSGPYVDHQSVLYFPNSYHNRNQVNVEFVKDFLKFLRHERTVILGGSDESYPTAQADSFIRNNPHFMIHSGGYVFGDVARKDKRYPIWTTFNTLGGVKARFTLEPELLMEMVRKYEKPFYGSTTYPVDLKKVQGRYLEPEFLRENFPKVSLPELVDIKITDYCDKGCRFCYESSTTKGKHASLEDLKTLVDALVQMEVMEIALGGGDPTYHPQLEEFIDYAKERGLSVGLTTRNPEFFTTEKGLEILKKVSGIAWSFEGIKKFKEIYTYEYGNKEKYPYVEFARKATCQFVVGVTPLNQIKEVIELSKNYDFNLKARNFMLLGYKNFGFGVDYKEKLPTQEEMVSFIKHFKKQVESDGWSGRMLQIDTVFASQYQEALKKCEIDPILYTDREGDYSMAVDAVLQTASWSSYAPLTERLVARMGEWGDPEFYLKAFHHEKPEISKDLKKILDDALFES